MAIVDHRQRVIFVAQVTNALQVGDRAIHREDAIRDDQNCLRAVSASLFELGLQIRHVIIGETITRRLA